MRSSLLTFAGVALAATVLAAPAARAQDAGVLRFDEASGILALTSPYGPVDVGRLKTTLLQHNGVTVNTPLDVFCVDLLHYVSFDPSGWNVYLTNLASTDMSLTRQGPVNPSALMMYRKQAWLADQFASVTTAADTAGIQAAMWLQFESSLAPYSFATLAEASATFAWMSSVDTFAASSDFAAYDWSRFTILTDVNAVGRGSADYRGYQEFVTIGDPRLSVTATPEPASLALLATGIVGVGFVVRRRRTRA